MEKDAYMHINKNKQAEVLGRSTREAHGLYEGGSNLPTFFRVGASASARDADCADLSASQANLLARPHCIGGGVEEEEAEVFSTPPLTQQDPQRQCQSQRGQAGEGEDSIAMCSMPFTQTQPSSSSSASSDSRERKPRVCMRKVRAGAKIWTPTLPPTQTPSPSPELGPLVRIVLMIPTAPLPTTGHEDILELARSRGIFRVAYVMLTK
ncbi:unnamed protein product [Miscanthus lutarioriparius]|uniref:Uncharacterized protein n=1 Tax=Miscanthus lutarioriparius TaxID=422564 RepID=A0A811MIN9_9POAL|nr:unnamed protein product [Miscanthus lutarioriparius]